MITGLEPFFLSVGASESGCKSKERTVSMFSFHKSGIKGSHKPHSNLEARTASSSNHLQNKDSFLLVFFFFLHLTNHCESCKLCQKIKLETTRQKQNLFRKRQSSTFPTCIWRHFCKGQRQVDIGKLCSAGGQRKSVGDSRSEDFDGMLSCDKLYLLPPLMTFYYGTEAGDPAGNYFSESKRTAHPLPGPHLGSLY